MKKITTLADAFNESLLTPTKSSSINNTTDSSNLASEEQPDQDIAPNNSKQPTFYDSDEWEKFVDNVLANVNVPQPSTSRSSEQQQQSQQQQHPPCHQTQKANQTINITSASIAGGKFLFFPHSVSQATLNGRTGSNACTFIALYLAKAYHMNLGHVPSPVQISRVGCCYDVLYHEGECNA